MIGYQRKDGYPINEKIEDNNTSINNTSIILNNNNIYSAVIDYLNEKTNRTGRECYKPNSKDTKQNIRARLNEGYELEDFKIVIDKKCEEWLGTEMEKYLQPSTLFGSKFERYLKQKRVVVTTKKQNYTQENIVKGAENQSVKDLIGEMMKW